MIRGLRLDIDSRDSDLRGSEPNEIGVKVYAGINAEQRDVST